MRHNDLLKKLKRRLKGERGAACFLKLTSVLDRDKRLSTLAASNCCRIVERGSFHSSSSDQTSRKTPIIDF